MPDDTSGLSDYPAVAINFLSARVIGVSQAKPF